MKILLIKRGAIGDLLMATPLIRQLKQKLDARIDLFVGRDAAIACQGNSYIDNLYILPDREFSIKGVMRLSYRLLKVFKRYDYVFMLDKHWYFNLLSRLTGSKTVGYYRTVWEKYLLTYAVLYHDVTRYHCCYYLDLLKMSELVIPDYNDLQIDLVIMDNDRNKIDEMLQQHKLDNFIVIVNSGGNNAYEKTGIRMLPPDKILELLKGLIDNNQKIILIGGSIDKDNYANYVRVLEHGSNSLVYNWAGLLSLAQSAELISRAQYFYTTDCGAMHLGVAMQLHDRMLAFFGPTNPAHILPQSYLINSAIWQDEMRYDSKYQLKGKLRKSEPLYFTTLEIGQYCKNL